jgi:hypothetical protein
MELILEKLIEGFRNIERKKISFKEEQEQAKI